MKDHKTEEDLWPEKTGGTWTFSEKTKQGLLLRFHKPCVQSAFEYRPPRGTPGDVSVQGLRGGAAAGAAARHRSLHPRRRAWNMNVTLPPKKFAYTSLHQVSTSLHPHKLILRGLRLVPALSLRTEPARSRILWKSKWPSKIAQSPANMLTSPQAAAAPAMQSPLCTSILCSFSRLSTSR